MTAELTQHIATIAPDGLQINLWQTANGYQANVKERAAPGWTVASDPDPVAAMTKALRQRVSRHPSRPVGDGVAPSQVDLEEYLDETVPESKRNSAVDCAHGVPMNLPCGACEADAAPPENKHLTEFGL